MNYLKNVKELINDGYKFNKFLTEKVLPQFCGEIATDMLACDIINYIKAQRLVVESMEDIRIGMQSAEGERGISFGIFTKEKEQAMKEPENGTGKVWQYAD